MGTKNLVEKVNSLYHSTKDFIKNPRAYFVAPLAFAAALSYSSRINAGTFTDDFDNNQFDIVNYSVNPPSRSNYVDEVGTWTRLNEEYEGVQVTGVEVNFKEVKGPIDSYVIEINANVLPEDGKDYTMQLTDTKGTPETSDDIKIELKYFNETTLPDRHEFGTESGGGIAYIYASTGLTKIAYKFIQHVNGDIEAWVSENDESFQFIGVADATTYNIGLDNLIPSFYGYFDNTNGNNASGNNAYQFDLLELKGANIENNLALTSLTNLILFSLLFGIPLKKLLEQKED